MSKPTVYVDTNILSSLYYQGADTDALIRRSTTREWWDTERPFFLVFASKTVESELAAGEYPGKERALSEVRRLPYLPPLPAVKEITDRLLGLQIVPASKPNDAIQLAFATAHGIDYLLSWNRAHLVNEETQTKLTRLREATGWRPPLLVSPATIPKVALGQSVRRRT